MTVVLRIGPDIDIDLGGTFPALRAFQEMGRLEPGAGYPYLFAIPHGYDEVDLATGARIREQAADFLTLHRDELDDHARWILEQLAVPLPGEDALGG